MFYQQKQVADIKPPSGLGIMTFRESPPVALKNRDKVTIAYPALLLVLNKLH